jgi:hypothetical protein
MKSFIPLLTAVIAAAPVRAETPVASYIFPAGGQRGTTVNARVGGLFLHNKATFHILGPGVSARKTITPMPTLWFEGPLLPLPDSQRQEDYPKDMAGQIVIARDAPLGLRYWQLTTSQGATAPMKFVVGDLPEIVEEEIDGDPIPVPVTLPVTINGRIFPRANVDAWAFKAQKGQAVTCEVEAARLGSPLEARLFVVDGQGRRLAESEPGGDPRLRFSPPRDGTYQVRIHDVNFHGSQAHVYRLTLTAGPYVDRVFPLGGRRGTNLEVEVAGQGLPAKAVVALPGEENSSAECRLAGSNPFWLDVDDLDEFADAALPVKVPAVCNGRILKPGQVDGWQMALKKGEALEAELRAARLGSPLDGILTVMDAAGKELTRVEAPLPETGDPLLRFTAPADGAYTIRVQDRFHSRSGPAFAYRLRLIGSPEPDFRLRLPAAFLNIPRGGKGQLQVAVDRSGGFQEPVTLAVDGLPKGVTAKWPDAFKGTGPLTINFEVDKEAPIAAARITIRATAEKGTRTITGEASMSTPWGQPPLAGCLVAVAMPTPFKVKGEYDMRWAARGSSHTRKYQIERNGFEGPLVISLTDRQARHLQGVRAEPIAVPAGATEFNYTVHLPPWMEMGRTSRTCVMAVGVIKDKDGSEHEVSFSSVNQNEQLVAVVEPGKIGLNLDRASLAVAPGAMLSLPFQVARGPGLKGPVTVGLVLPAHIKGIHAQPVTLTDEHNQGSLVLQCGDNPGPFNMPLVVRATLVDHGNSVEAEAQVEMVRGR